MGFDLFCIFSVNLVCGICIIMASVAAFSSASNWSAFIFSVHYVIIFCWHNVLKSCDLFCIFSVHYAIIC